MKGNKMKQSFENFFRPNAKTLKLNDFVRNDADERKEEDCKNRSRNQSFEKTHFLSTFYQRRERESECIVCMCVVCVRERERKGEREREKTWY